jgi:phage terminase large subunit-like protein
LQKLEAEHVLRAAYEADEVALQEKRERREAATEYLAEFVKQAWHIMEPDTPLLWNWHLDCICAHLEAVTFGLIRRLIINVPPGHMKSLITSVFWPAWMWLREPGTRILCASYGLDLAIRDATKTKDLVLDDWYRETFQPEWNIRTDSKAKQNYQNTARGSRKSMSVGSGTTGNRGHGVIIDDPLSIMDGFSEAKRSEASTWLFQAAQNRLSDPRTGWLVMIMQRVHHEDPTGTALQKKVDKWEHVCLMSEFEEERRFRTLLADLPPEHLYYERFQKWGTDLRQKEGELLFPEFFTDEVIEGQKEALQAVAYAGQHQQRPTPAQGNIFQADMFLEILSMEKGEPRLGLWPCSRIFDGSLKVREAYFAWDTAMKDKTTNDYTAGCLAMMCDDGYVYLYPVEFRRMTVPEVEKTVALKWVEWRNRLQRRLKGARIEEGAGTALIQYIRRLMLQRREMPISPIPGWSQDDWDMIRATDPINVLPFNTTQKKIEKAYEVLPFCMARNVRLLDTPLSYGWLSNLLAFPLGGKDDPVDATVNAIGPFAGVVKGLSVMPPDELEAVLEPDSEAVDLSVYENTIPLDMAVVNELEDVGALVDAAMKAAGLDDFAAILEDE